MPLSRPTGVIGGPQDLKICITDYGRISIECTGFAIGDPWLQKFGKRCHIPTQF